MDKKKKTTAATHKVIALPDLYMLSVGQREAINQSRRQIKQGKYLTDKQANKEIDEWLKRQWTIKFLNKKPRHVTGFLF